MLKKTEGLVINYLKYKESSIIVKVFTRDLGLKSYIVNGVRSTKSKMGFYQPLTILDLVVYDKEKSSLNRVSEVKLAYAFQRIPFDFYRSGIAMFIGEVLGKSIYENYQNENLFDFLKEAIKYLDQQDANIQLYPISFLLETSKFLGFGTSDASELFEQLFGLVHDDDFAREEKTYLNELMAHSFAYTVKVPAVYRRKILDDLLKFYQLHLDGFTDLKSVKVLRSLY
ncbi:DNA repair protein RecO [Anditalea andensis]|uniref:DNA repair protein RecO n=1 Tax=Anditalea andensis TaxID=1048983 RepID=A0A074KZI9_9BACT|nr:DNA repair protein RecO [Anditalea andensis]KEO73033.1 DNA recombination protein RecO [Anditalea andensis]